MVGRDERSHPGRVASLALLLLVIETRGVLAQRGAAGRIPTEPEAARSDLERGVAQAVRLASGKLATEACRQVFSDFQDASGRTLQQNLDALGQTGESYLKMTMFYTGYGKTICESRDTLASTITGSRAIFICAPQFSQAGRRDDGLTAAIIIHEELHSLGLGENPPTSKQITAQVIARCGK